MQALCNPYLWGATLSCQGHHTVHGKAQRDQLYECARPGNDSRLKQLAIVVTVPQAMFTSNEEYH